MINKIILGHALTELPKLPAESVSCVTTSPPYWGLRDYGVEPVIWDGDKEFYSESLKKYIPLNCEHDFDNVNRLHPTRGNRGQGVDKKYPIRESQQPTKVKSNFCLKCNAWRGSLGLEPTFELYIKHLCDIFDEIKRVLRKDGTCFVNIGDTYAGGGGWTGVPDDWESVSTGSKQKRFDHNKKHIGISAKSLCDIPYRFSIEMINRGWIKRNTIIWYKKNCMPSSADDRFTVDFEYLFFFTKNNKAIFWTNEKTLECVGKSPLGTKGTEGKDWEWKECPNCRGTGKAKVNIKDRPEIYGENDPAGMRRGRMRDSLDKKKETYQAGDKPCKRCKGSGKIKYSFWSGHDYWFDQQFEELNYDSFRETKRGFNQPKGNRQDGIDNWKLNPQGRNKRCVWIIPTQPFPEAHFAVYPEELIEIPIKAGCPEFICKKCGKARVKIYKKETTFHSGSGKARNIPKGKWEGKEQQISGNYDIRMGPKIKNKELGYTDCGCNAGFEPGVVLDPFMGSGTSALVALKQRKRFIGIDIKQEYIDMAYRKIAKVQQRIF